MKRFALCTMLTLLSMSAGSLLVSCAPSLRNSKIVESADVKEMRGCKELGSVTGKSHWGGLTGQETSLRIAKQRALAYAETRGATTIVWTKMERGFFGATVTGAAFACSEKVIPLATSLAPGKQAPGNDAGIMRFEAAGADSATAAVVADVFTNRMQANGKYRIMERAQLYKILNEQGFQQSGACGSAECAVSAGRLLSIDKMFIGSVGKLGESWVMSVRLVDIKTGEVTATASKQVVGKIEQLSRAAIMAADELSR
jgi:hypothetical protein